jgi:hypothetical protein
MSKDKSWGKKTAEPKLTGQKDSNNKQQYR